MPSSLSFRFWIVCLWTLSSHFSNASAFASARSKLTTTATASPAKVSAFSRQQQLHPRRFTVDSSASSYTSIWSIARGGEQEEILLDDDETVGTEETAAPADEPEPTSLETATEDPTTTSPSHLDTLKAGVGSVAIMGQSALGCVGKFYTQSLDTFPILTKSCTAGLIFGLSDLLAQKIEQKNTPVNADGKKKKNNKDVTPAASMNWTRLAASTLVGLLYFGPAAHYWYEAIFRLLPGTSMLSTLYKAFWGQILFGPSFNCVRTLFD